MKFQYFLKNKNLLNIHDLMLIMDLNQNKFFLDYFHLPDYGLFLFEKY